MQSVGIPQAITLAGGELVCGIALAIQIQTFYNHGFKIGIRNDAERQVLLNGICFCANVMTILSTGFNATKASVVGSDIGVFSSFVLIQYGIVILNHNTIIRFFAILQTIYQSVTSSRQLAERISLSLYFLPPFVLIPIYLSFAEKAGTGTAMNTSNYNSQIYKPMNIALIVTTEVLAIATDLVLILKARQESRKRKSNQLLSMDILTTYAITWFFVAADVILKAIIASGQPLLFDNNLSIATLTFRSKANLQFGLELQLVLGTKAKSPQHKDIASGIPIQAVSQMQGSMLNTNQLKQVEKHLKIVEAGLPPTQIL